MATAYRKYVAAIIFTRTKQGNLFLLLRRKQNWKGWEYVKGGLLPGESLKAGLKRELKEETGQKKFKVIAKLAKQIKYKWPHAFQKDNKKWQGAIQQVYLVEVFSKRIKLDRKEHAGYAWLPAAKTMKLLTHKEPKSALRDALEKYKLN